MATILRHFYTLADAINIGFNVFYYSKALRSMRILDAVILVLYFVETLAGSNCIH